MTIEDNFLADIYRKGKSGGSVKSAQGALSNFKKWSGGIEEKIKQYNSMNVDDILRDLDQWVANMDSKGTNPRSIKQYFSTIKKLLRKQSIKLHSEDIKDMIVFPQEVNEPRHAISKKEIRLLLDHSSYERKLLYMCNLSTGCRIGELLMLKKRDFNLETRPITVTIPAKFTKKKISRTTYLNSEVSPMFLEYVKKLSHDDRVFSKSETMTQATENEDVIFAKIRRKAGLMEKYPDSKRYKVNIHCFRAYVETMASDVNGLEYAHALIGHSGYLSEYYRKTEEQRIELYKKLDSYLFVYDDAKKEFEGDKIESLERRIEESQKDKKEQRQKMEEMDFKLLQLQQEVGMLRRGARSNDRVIRSANTILYKNQDKIPGLDMKPADKDYFLKDKDLEKNYTRIYDTDSYAFSIDKQSQRMFSNKKHQS